jgi:hypothetical protein
MALSLPLWLGIGVLHGVLTWWVVGGPVLTAALLNTAAALATVATRAADKADAVAIAATWWAVLFVLSIIGRGLMT